MDIDAFIAQKRAQKQNDELIMEELVALGWDRTAVLRKLAGEAPAAPAVAVPGTAATTQTGVAGVPLQMENVQYNVNVGKVRSKVGLSFFIWALSGWVLVLTIGNLLTSIRSAVMRDPGVVNISSVIVASIAFLVPVLPIFLLVQRRTDRLLAENPANIDDVYFKKSLRFHLVIAIIAAVGWVIGAVYNILSALFLHEGTTGAVVGDSIIWAVVLSGLAYLFLRYQSKTKR